ncbi:hypothetical protein LTR78_009730 [Recurvomyces mirabilis]|uniref:Glutathione S-transferase n=1 Tax=Recurvomyces mirabilis TaxID=574656 RepID=A0AAE0TRB3_9PEZI|nr:hypothetical protein LTR78_009730 [Recurvomyces mirabilis]KAK5156353.1 hypothetical protein LTS14_005241 [Recurvomyces mirabilis]
MASNTKPLTLYSHAGGPNPWKVAIILNALSIPYENKLMDFPDLKKAPFEAINPNGRVPALEDPNTNTTVWESGACIDYLLETYDTSNTLHAKSGPQTWAQKSWSHFQTSGQGPYYGQRAWFVLYAPEKIELCLNRYSDEIKRVLGVIDRHLKSSGQKFLTGNEASYADLMFVPWHWLLLQKPFINGEEFPKEFQSSFPTAWEWHKRLSGIDAVEKAREARNQAMSKGH